MLDLALGGASLVGQVPVAAEGGTSALVTFALYILAVFALAWLSGRLLAKKNFLSEYFLGSRGLGMWAFALTFAATSSSGGSFIGFPSFVYTHGWIVALWIASYMTVPIVAMGLLGKRINHVARRSGAITLPDVLWDRFDSPKLGGLATLLIVFFMSINLVGQFKGGSLILQSLMADVPLYDAARGHVAHWLADASLRVDAGYLICLAVFTAVVVVYTTYGGFRAVVWTDVLQGFVMVGGVIIMLPLALWLSGGLSNVTRTMAQMTPPQRATITLTASSPVSQRVVIPKETWVSMDETHPTDVERRIFRTMRRAEIPVGQTTARLLGEVLDADPTHLPALEITTPEEREHPSIRLASFDPPLAVQVVKSDDYAYGAVRQGVYVTGPGPHATRHEGFLPLSMAISMFFMWTFSGAGQPSNMVRLMAFKNSQTLRRAIVTVAVYYSLIYFPLVVIFCCARVLLPGWEIESDRIMPEMARTVTYAAGVPFLAGLLLAAPFAAVMSTMDSFLLMISSALVRDVYQRHIHPAASEQTIKRLTYAATLLVGLAAMIGALRPPQYLQDIIIFTNSGLSSCFLAPLAMSLYWPRTNLAGAFAGMLGGFAMHLSLYLGGYVIQGRPMLLFGLDPAIPGMGMSLLTTVAVSLLTPPPPEKLVRKFFYCEEKAGT